MAKLYEGGSGLPKDDAKAAEWQRKAMKLYLSRANNGDASAQHDLGVIYQRGYGETILGSLPVDPIPYHSVDTLLVESQKFFLA